MADSDSGQKSAVRSLQSTQRANAGAIERVLAGDVNDYEEIYAACDRSLRTFVGWRYGHLGQDFVDEVAIRTHECACNHLNLYNSDRSSYQTWLRLRSPNVAAEVITERCNLHGLDPRGKRRYVALSDSLGEEGLATLASPEPSPAEEHEARERSRRLRQAYAVRAGCVSRSTTSRA